MIKKITPNFLRHLIVLLFFAQASFLFSQTVNVSLTVNWPNWARENKVELFSPDNVLLLTITHPSGYLSGSSTGSSSDNYSATVAPSPANVSVNDNVPSGSGYYVKLYDGWGDGWNGSGSLTISVDGDTAYSFDGNFTDSDSNNEISQTEYFAINKGLDDASFSYGSVAYCQSETDPIPTITGETGGTFSSTSGLSINASTGAIDVSASTINSYVVTYTTTSPDQNSATFNVAISDGDVATVNYSYAFASQSDSDLTAEVTGQGGTFSSTSGLDINASSGTIDVSGSISGTYIVSYTTNGSCSKVYTNTITIENSPFISIYASSTVDGVTTNYNNNASKQYIEYIPGTMPVIISAPHGGTITGSELTTRSCGTGEMDDNTDILIREIQKRCYQQFGVYPYIIINNLRRNKLDPNRNKSVATCGNSSADEYFDAYHTFIDQASEDVTNKFGKGLYIDLHGQSHSIPRIEAGYNLSSSSFDEDLDNTITNATELARVTIKNLIGDNIQNLSFEDLIRGSQSFGGLMQVTGGAEYAALGHAGCSRTMGYRTVPSHISTGSSQGSCDDTNPGNNSYFAGDYYSNIRHGSGSTSYANSVVGGGGNVNGGGGTIDGVMTEVNRRVRDLGSAYSSSYGRSDSRDATVPYFSRDYGQVLQEFIDLHYNDFSNFAYENSTYDITDANPIPVVSGISGGVFSTTSGLIINNSTTGEIDLINSTAGTYTIKYIAPNINEYYSKETTITITENIPLNRFTSSSGSWSNTSNWSKARIPLVTDNVIIPSGNTAMLDITNASVLDISVAGTLQINAGKALTVTGDITITGNTIVNSDATSSGSLLVQGTATGEISYNRYIKGISNWFMVSSPVENQDIDEFVSGNPIATGSSTNVGLSNYNNVLSVWEYYQNNASNSGDFIMGEGRAIRISSVGNVTYTGTILTENASPQVTLGTTGWNLLGNPFPSFINANQSANSNNIIDANFALLDSGYKAIYFWDTASTSYKPYNNASNATYVSPGQGFFVKVNENSTLAINENMQTYNSNDLFLKGNKVVSDNFEIQLNLSDGSTLKSTEIKYIKGTTTGLDEGYDAALFNSNTTTFDIYSHLVSKEDALKYALQALPNTDYENMVIPIGLNAKADTNITFTINSVNIPKGIVIFIEDKETGGFYKLDEDTSSYSVALTSDISGEGRFYIHTKPNTILTTEDESIIDNVKLYTNDKTLYVNGLSQNGTLQVFSLLGKEVAQYTLANKLEHKIKLPKITAGVYFIKIATNTRDITKKIVIE